MKKMKKMLLIIVAMLTISSANAENTLNGFMGIPFGTSKSEIVRLFKEKQPKSTIHTDDGKVLTFTDCQFAGRNAIAIVFALNDQSQVHTVTVLLDNKDYEVWTVFDEVVSDIESKYKPRTGEYENWSYPYDKNDKYTHGITALKVNKLKKAAYWYFPVETGNSDDDNVINVTINDNCHVKIIYQNGVMINQVVEKNKQKNSKDY